MRATFIAHGVPSTDKKENLQRATLLYDERAAKNLLSRRIETKLRLNKTLTIYTTHDSIKNRFKMP